VADEIYGGEYRVYIGSDRALTFSPETPTSVSGQTFEVRIIDPLGNVDTVTITHGSLSITAATGVIVATLTRAITLALLAGHYNVELWRIDSGNYGKISYITIEVQP